MGNIRSNSSNSRAILDACDTRSTQPNNGNNRNHNQNHYIHHATTVNKRPMFRYIFPPRHTSTPAISTLVTVARKAPSSRDHSHENEKMSVAGLALKPHIAPATVGGKVAAAAAPAPAPAGVVLHPVPSASFSHLQSPAPFRSSSSSSSVRRLAARSFSHAPPPPSILPLQVVARSMRVETPRPMCFAIASSKKLHSHSPEHPHLLTGDNNNNNNNKNGHRWKMELELSGYRNEYDRRSRSANMTKDACSFAVKDVARNQQSALFLLRERNLRDRWLRHVRHGNALRASEKG